MMKNIKKILVWQTITASSPEEDCCDESCHYLVVTAGEPIYCSLFESYMHLGLRCPECFEAEKYTSGIKEAITNLHFTVNKG